MKLNIVIVTFHEKEAILRACFDSIVASDLQDLEVFVVDNGNDAETKALVTQYKGFNYIANPANLGFAKAVNIGMKRGSGEYALLLNPDTTFEKNVLSKMIKHLDADQEVGIGSCLIRYPDGSHQESIRRFPKLFDQLLILFKVPHFFRTKAVDAYMMRETDPHKTQDVDSIMGAFMFIRRRLMEKIGLFDERYFIWFEEVDYCKMAHDAGAVIRHYADVEITHHKGLTFSGIATLKKQKWIRQSMRKYFYKHHGVVQGGVLTLLAPAFIVFAYLTAFIKKH